MIQWIAAVVQWIYSALFGRNNFRGCTNGHIGSIVGGDSHRWTQTTISFLNGQLNEVISLLTCGTELYSIKHNFAEIQCKPTLWQPLIGYMVEALQCQWRNRSRQLTEPLQWSQYLFSASISLLSSNTLTATLHAWRGSVQSRKRLQSLYNTCDKLRKFVRIAIIIP